MEPENHKPDLNRPCLVTVITQVLNNASYVEECLRSVLRQTYPHVEHVIIDGKSTDGTVEILARYGQRHPERVRFLSEPDRGTGDAWNKGLRMARGDILGWIGSDDMFEPDAVETAVRFFQAHPEAWFVYGGVHYINEKGALIRSQRTVPYDYQKLLQEECMIPTPSSFYRKDIFAQVGEFDLLGNDFDFFLRAAERFPIHSVDKILSNYRVHSGSQNSGANLKLRVMWKREDCLVSRRHGARFFSGYCRRYYLLAALLWLRSFLTAPTRLFRKIRPARGPSTGDGSQ